MVSYFVNKFLTSLKNEVLILVVVEDGLVLIYFLLCKKTLKVLILVVVEDGLVRYGTLHD